MRRGKTCRCPGGSMAFVVGLLGCVVVVAGLLASAPAMADGSGNADVVIGIGCMEDEAEFGLNCTANDVSIANVTNITILDDGCAFLGDTVTFSADFEVLLTAQARHDVGMWFSTDGDPNADGAISGICTAATPAYAPDPPWLDLDGTSDDPGGVIQDTCGDIDANHNPLFPNVTLTATCIDPDGDGKLDLPNCTSWRQPGANDLCTSPQQAFPGAPSKCKCDPGFDIDIDVPPVDPCVGFDCSALDDQCNDGVCVVVDGQAHCEADPKADSTPCEDGSYCTSETGAPGTSDHCKTGQCVGIPVDCGDGDQCNDDVCNEATDSCEVVPKADSTPCEDGSYCTSETGAPGTSDHCKTGQCVGIPVDCGDGDQCNDDVCNEATDSCEVVPKADSTPCEDGSYCTSETGAPGTPDHCETGQCVGIPVDCGDGDQCNDDVCNEATDSCEVVPKADSTPCEDGDICTSETGDPQTPDHCFDGVCTGIPVDCSALDDQCNDGVCNAETGACEADPKAESTPCDDPFFCTSFGGVPGDRDHCDGAGNCVGDPVDCNDGFVCTEDTCNEGTDQCDNDWICNQPSISITYLGLVFDSTTMLSGGWGISNESEEPGVEVVVSEFDLLVEVRLGNKGPWREVAATCTFNPEAPVAIPEDDYNDSTAELVGTYMCTLDDATLESGDGVRVTLEATILDRAKVFKYRTTMTY